ncbi:MAG: FAD-binding protein [Acidimicrobiia bacterium]|nr:FAD-binding protein [Acidimicrobiia bacterium]
MMLRQELARLARGLIADPIAGAPEVEITVVPKSYEDAAAVLEFAATNGLRVMFWAGGNHQDIGNQVDPDIVMSTAGLNRIVAWQVEDMTVVVQPGVTVAELEASLQQKNQTAVLPEAPGTETVGGVVAAGLSGWRRLRYGPTRDRMLEVRLVTGDGRLVRGGGRLVKNVTGYDLPRLVTGSLGSLGLIAEMCLKLWPLPEAQATVRVDDPDRALATAYRPLALIATPHGTHAYLAGTHAEVEAQCASLGGEAGEGHRWPEPMVGSHELALRVPAGDVTAQLRLLADLGCDYQAAYGVGEVKLVADGVTLDDLGTLRDAAESAGGSLTTIRGKSDFDPWGTPPSSVELQRRVKAAFDPRRIANPGILPGGV